MTEFVHPTEETLKAAAVVGEGSSASLNDAGRRVVEYAFNMCPDASSSGTDIEPWMELLKVVKVNATTESALVIQCSALICLQFASEVRRLCASFTESEPSREEVLRRGLDHAIACIAAQQQQKKRAREPAEPEGTAPQEDAAAPDSKVPKTEPAAQHHVVMVGVEETRVFYFKDGVPAEVTALFGKGQEDKLRSMLLRMEEDKKLAVSANATEGENQDIYPACGAPVHLFSVDDSMPAAM